MAAVKRTARSKSKSRKTFKAKTKAPAKKNIKNVKALKKAAKKSTKKAAKKTKGKRSSPTVIVRNSGIHGKGMFANAAFAKGERIIEYKGKRIPEAEADEKYGDDEGTHTFLFLLDNAIVIDANFNGNSARWINHSCDPNCDANEVKGRMYIEALKPIKPGDELTYDYHLIVEERRTPALKKMYACFCGTRKCRGTILGER